MSVILKCRKPATLVLQSQSKRGGSLDKAMANLYGLINERLPTDPISNEVIFVYIEYCDDGGQKSCRI